MKFIHYLEKITGIEVYPMISLIVFFVFFTLLLLYIFKTDKHHFSKIENLPLEK
jgi:hypothetical protein